jgi:hypothetical protein
VKYGPEYRCSENGFGRETVIMGKDPFETIFTPDCLAGLFPAERADAFFDALFGDASEGAYDIRLSYDGMQDNHLQFAFHLSERPGKCLSCSLTYGLPHVFSRHPVIDVAGLVNEIDQMLDGAYRCGPWEMGRTQEIDRGNHAVPLKIALDKVR